MGLNIGELGKWFVRGFIVLDMLVGWIYWVVIVIFFVVIVVLVVVNDNFVVYFLVFNFVVNGLNDVWCVRIGNVIGLVVDVEYWYWYVKVSLDVVIVNVCSYD